MGKSDDQNLNQLFGLSLCRRRKQLEMTQERLAELSSLHVTYISAVENGRRNVSLAVVERLCKALEIDPALMFSATATATEASSSTR